MAGPRGEAEPGDAGSAIELRHATMVSPLEIAPILLMILAIVLIPLLSDGPPG
jgi:hypothetical protein